ncbi:LexA family protein [Tellurirhabdus bombi]|uniref:LexA family protein n=1 Tax=Tellurirhabdus bombi TaxID=2907205 RepID=UPI001F327176|nr:translesion error-prone DNA polymerase V autoproteolytic subunit [Tellurirhabdus bombi]
MISQFHLLDRLSPENFYKAKVGAKIPIPFFDSKVAAGFPSPAENHIEKVCDLNELCITDKEATYFVRVGGDSMSGDRIEPGDVLIVDCTREHVEGKVVVVWLNGDHAVKRMQRLKEMVVLHSSNPKYNPIYVHPGDDFRLFGVVTHVIQKLA